MRENPTPGSNKASIVTILIIINIAVFVLQQVLNVMFPGFGGQDNYFLTDWFALSAENFKSLKVWTIFTYGFLHSTSSLVHIIGNMLGLFFIGRMIEPMIGKQRFLLLYLGSAFLGGLIYLMFHINGGNPVIGASASVFGLLAFFCLARPEQPITLLIFFIIPVTLKPKWIFWGSLGISLFAAIFYELRGQSGVAHSAHLGGIFCGILFYKYLYVGKLEFGVSSKPTVELPDWFKRKNKTDTNISYRVNRSTSSREELQKEVDRILDKINDSGFGSLDDSEKHTLDQAKDILSR
jgi:membrane associated rhomboid family serine protease